METAVLASLAAPVPTIEDFILSEEYLALKPYVCDAVLETLSTLFAPTAPYRDAALEWGIGAGKSYLVSIASAYLAYRLLCAPSPHKFYGLDPATTIAIANYSISASQAQHIVFGSIVNLIDRAPCFKEPGFQRDLTIRSELRWPEKNVVIMAGNSQSSSALGYNLFGAVIDEAAFLQDVERSSRKAGRSVGERYDAAEELYGAIRQRMTSRGNAEWRAAATLMMISSPCHVDDFMEREIALFETGTNPKLYAHRMPTWEGAPKKSLSGEKFWDDVCGEVPIEYKEVFDRSPEVARRDLGAVASEALEPFFTVRESVEDARDETLPCILDIRPGRTPAVRLVEGTTFDTAPRFAHVDLGLKHDRAGIGVCHWAGERLIWDVLTYLEAADFESREIDLSEVRGLLLEMHDAGCRFRMVTYDGWNSADSQQILKKAGIPTALLSVDRTTGPYDDLKTVLYDHLAGMPVDERSEMFWREARRLELVNGKKVDHPVNGSKDVADAAAGSASNALAHPTAPRVYSARMDSSPGAREVAQAEQQMEPSQAAAGVPVARDMLGNPVDLKALRRLARMPRPR